MTRKVLRPVALIGTVAAMLTVTIVLTLSHATVSLSGVGNLKCYALLQVTLKTGSRLWLGPNSWSVRRKVMTSSRLNMPMTCLSRVTGNWLTPSRSIFWSATHNSVSGLMHFNRSMGSMT